MSGGFDDVRTSGGFRSLGGEEADPRAEIEHTRAELNETIGAIQERLAPSGPTGGGTTDLVSEAAERSAAMAREVVEQAIQEATKQAKVAIVEITAQAQVSAGETARALTEQAKASMREATIGRVERMATNTGEAAKGFRTTVVETIKQNPGPAALTALGIGWLVTAGGGSKTGTTNQGTASQATSSPASSGASTNGQSTSMTSQAADAVGQAVDQVQQTVGDAASQAQATAGQVVDQTTQTVGQVVGQVTETAGQAAEKTTSALGAVPSGVKGAVTGLVNGVQHQAQRARTAATESPLRAGVTAAVVGGALGMALPVTKGETALLGQTRDNLVDQFEQRAQTTLTKLQDVAQEAGGAAEREAKYQGIVPGQS